jgi:cellulose synthase (UDP-forming)
VASFYFDRFEARRPPAPLPMSPLRQTLWHYLASLNLALGAFYLVWRWTHSLNYDALWFAVPLALAETFAYVGLVLFTINLWSDWTPPQLPPPRAMVETDPDAEDRPIKVDVFIATYSEEEELVRLSIRDAKALRAPAGVEIAVYVLDDGRRPAMREVCEQEGVGWLTRPNNVGYKAGNLRAAMEQTDGDFLVICDADTRVFPSFVENTLGYFRDPKVAFVQTPQWFYDLPEGVRLRDYLGSKLGRPGRWVGGAVEKVVGEIRLGEDPFANDPQMFYDVILRRRNWANAVFCCGAGSIHRREAVMFAALRGYAFAVEQESRRAEQAVRKLTKEKAADPETRAFIAAATAQDVELTPYKFHVSEDIYTSIVLHQDRRRGWKSILHPGVESKMLSPQDLLSWTIQRFKYAGGSLDILFWDNPILKRGLSFWQRVMYMATFWSYLAALWNVVFILSPMIYLYTGVAPVSAFSAEFFGHLLPFLVANELAFMVGTWGVAGYKGKVAYLASFPISLGALWSVIRRQQIKFHVTPKMRQEGAHLHLIWPQLLLIGLTYLGMAVGAFRFGLGHEGFTWGGLIVNTFWGLNNILALSIMVQAVFWKPPEEQEESS